MGTVTSELADTRRPAPPQPLRWDRWLLALGVPLGLLLMFFLRPSLSPDAPFHFLRIDQITQGHLVSPRASSGSAIASPGPCAAGEFTSLFSQWLNSTPGGPQIPASAGTGAHTGPHQWRPADGLHSAPCKARAPVDMSNSALNSPVAYLPALAGYGIGRLVSGPFLGVWLARLAGLAAYLALCWLALRIAPSGRPLLFLVALAPTSLTLAANLSADPMAISLALLVVALLLRLRTPADHSAATDRSGRLLAGLAAAVVLLALSKNLYAPFALTLLLVPRWRFRSARKRVAYVAAVMGPIVVAAGLWSVFVVNRVRFILFWNGADSVKQRAWIQAHPIGYLKIVARSLFATPVLLNHTIPGLVAPAWSVLQSRSPSFAESVISLGVTIALIACALTASRRTGGAPHARADGSRREERVGWLVVGVIFAAVLALVIYGESVASADDLWLNPKINYIEGRYFLPVLPLVLLPLGSRGALLTDGTSRSWSWTLPAGIVLVTLWCVIHFGGIAF